MSLAPEWDNAQYQPVTIVLRNIIQDYEAGGGILLELCQNADDAGASKIEFVLDRTQYIKTNILNAGLAGYQGPALLAYNNRPFEEDDFKSLRRIGDSGKIDDLNSTGKFGKGFNSVYNWTDSPSILSGTSLLILDPHKSWSTGGPVYNFVKNSRLPEMRNQLSAFDSILKDKDKGKQFDGAIIRIPLRRKDRVGDIGIVSAGKCTTPEDVEEVLYQFSGELVKSLLFLRNLNSITLKIGDKIIAQATSEFVGLPSPMDPSPSTNARKKPKKRNKHKEKAEINAAYTRVYDDKVEDVAVKNFLMDISFRSEEYPPGKELKFKYAVSHHLRKGLNDAELQLWTVKNKLFPWTAIAAPLEGSVEFKGSLFNTLPLPIGTNHPVHIQGMFSVTSDRVKLHSGGDWTTSRNSDAKLGARWNEWLFTECVPQTWVQNLEFLRDIGGRGESGWEFWPTGSAEAWKERGTRVLGGVFERVVKKNLKLLPTVCGTTAAGKDVLFTLESVDRYEPAFREAQIPVVIPPPASRFELNRLNPQDLPKILSPATLRRDLELERNIGGLSHQSRILLLHYAILDEDFLDIGQCKAPLVPIVDGSYQSFHKSEKDKTGPAFLPLDDDEVQLFNKHTRRVDVAALGGGTEEILQRNIKELNTHTGISNWTLDAAAGYCKRHIFTSSNDDIIMGEGPAQSLFVDKLWRWIEKRKEHPSAISSSALGSMWLLPLVGGEYRKLESTIPILDVAKNKGIGAFIWNRVKQYKIKCALFTGQGIVPETTEYLRRCGFLRDYEDIEALMSWLTANSTNFVDRLNGEERGKLLYYLSGLASDCIGVKRVNAMKDAVKSLKIFKINGSAQWISMDRLDSRHEPIIYIGVKDIPIILRHSDTIFVDIQDPDTMRLIDVLEVIKCPQPTEIFENYVIPQIVDSQDDNWGGESLAAIGYALQNFDLLSAVCKDELSQAKIVPVPEPTGTILRKCPKETVEPNSLVAALFFPEENRITEKSFFDQYRGQLIQLGVVCDINREVVLERVEEYGRSKHSVEEIDEKVQKLMSGCTIPPALPARLRQVRWIPARPFEGKLDLYSPEQCRGQKSEKLVRYIMPVAEFHITKAWSSCFGWDRSLPQAVVLRQLEKAVDVCDDEVIEHLIKQKHILVEEFPEKLKTMKWIPSTSGTYCSPANIFLDDFANLSPHFGTLDNRFKYNGLTFFNKIGVERAPSFQQLKELQDMFAKKEAPLGQADLDVALSVIKEVGKRYSGEENDLRNLKAPDKHGRMRNILELTAGDPGTTQTSRMILHPGVSLDTVKQLDLPTFEARFLEQLNDPSFEAVSAKNSHKAEIEDTLRKYSSSSTFREYLANAEDCGATRICWIIDETNDYPTTKLLSEKLAGAHGRALFCYNNGEFSESDFRGITEPGAGTKQDDPSKIGRFGRGALTMYYWTSVPSFISGDYFVIFDPDQSYLPAHPATGRPRAVMKMKIKDLREKWPEQLQPFEGIEGFNTESVSFPGTLFRFPLSAGALNPREYLDSHYDEASRLLLFMKNIDSISFRDKNSQVANWSVTSKAVAVVGKPQISHLTITGEFSEATKSVRSEWCVISGRHGEIPSKLEKTSRKHRLEATYGLAALISEAPEGGLCGGYFVHLPLPMIGISGFPVHLNANMVFQSDRRVIAIASGEEGSPWNKWILGGNCAARLYLDLVQYLMGISGVDGYRHWPEYKPLESETVSNILANTFWKLIRNEGNYSLYPSDGLLPTSQGTSDEQTPGILTMGEAIFNLLDTEPEREFFSSLLLELGLRTIVTPNNTVRNGLKELQLAPTRSITPRFLMDLFRGSPQYSEELLKIWGAHDHSIEYFNQFLFFIFFSGAPLLSSLIGCRLLPLASRDLGTFLQETADQAYLMARTPEEYEILKVSKSVMVHPGLEHSIASRLASSMSFNVRYFRSDDIKDLYPRLDIDRRDNQFKKEWLVKVWSYLRATIRSVPGTEPLRLKPLRDVQIYYGKAVGAVRDGDVFLSPSEFDNFACSAILTPSGETDADIAAIIGSFEGLILLERSAFPEGRMLEESLQNVNGAYRLLRSIHLLGSTDQLPSIEAYISKTVPNRITTLRKIFSPGIVSELMGSTKFPQAREYLWQLPLWPSTNSAIPIHQPATRAQLPPHPSLSRSGMTQGDIFIDAAVARQYREQLKSLGVVEMTIDSFLKEHVKAIPGCQIQKEQIPYFENLINILTAVYPQVFSDHPIGVDGNGTFQWLKSLYSPDNPIFMAAFQDPKHFLHLDHRHFRGWEKSPLVQTVTEESYLACARSIQERAADADGDEDLLVDAAIVFGYLCREDGYRDRETQTWSSSTWKKLSSIAFAPVKTSFDDPRHRHRVQRMTELLAGRKITKVADAVSPHHMDIAWSQYPVLEMSPSPLVAKHLTAVSPSATSVLSHLLFLWQDRGGVVAEHIPSYVADITKCYQWLQDLLLSGSDFQVPHEADVWFNADKPDVQTMTQDEFRESWLPSRVLCIGLDHDLGPLRHVRSFLAPYSKLMSHCNVKTMKPPNVPTSLHSTGNHSPLILGGLQKLRQEAWSTDVKIILEDQKFDAHCAVLCAMSGFWVRDLRARAGEAKKIFTFPASSKIKPESVSAVLDYMYTGSVPHTELLGVYSENLHNVLDQLFLAHEWELRELKAEMEQSLCTRFWIRPDYIRTIVKCAEYVGAADLLEICNCYVRENREIVDQLGVAVPAWDWYPEIEDKKM